MAKTMFKRIGYIIILLAGCVVQSFGNGNRYAANSVLSTGKWVKIRIDDTGIYKLSFAELKAMGFADPSKVSIHGYGGWPLDEDFSRPYTDDLPAVAMWKGDTYLLFYGRGPVKWAYNEKTGEYEHTNNPYASYGYYFVTDSQTPRIMDVVPLSQTSAALQFASFDDYAVHEKELISVNKSGRELFGENFSNNTTQTISSFQLADVTDEPGKVTVRSIAKASSPSEMTLYMDGLQLLSIPFATSPATDQYVTALPGTKTVDWTGAKSSTPQIKLMYNHSGHKNVYLDYVRLNMKRVLRPYGAYTFFRRAASIDNVSQFKIQQATSTTRVWDVTDPINPQEIEGTLDGTEYTFTIPASPVLREFVVIDLSKKFPQPVNAGVVSNQNLHSLPQTDMVIIVPHAFREQAERLAEEHRSRDGMHVTITEPDTIYNEFSSGTPDATAYRRFMKMFYDRQAADGADAPRYLLLFGSGAFDNRRITSEWSDSKNMSLLLTYQSQESLNSFSYVTDDYFGFLDDNEGVNLAADKLDIGIGRFPVRTQDDAKNVVDKLIAYMDNLQLGAWKNNLCFIGDDGDGNEHMSQADMLAEYVENYYPEFMTNKIYLDAFKKISTGGTEGFPDVRTKLQSLLKNGLMFLNYTGHGGTSGLAENILTLEDVTNATYPHLPMWITATCDFARYDAVSNSTGVLLFLNKKSGGIGLFTTTRVVYSDPNFIINKQLIADIFAKDKGKRLRLGDIMRNTKCNLGKDDSNKLNFTLLGDPALALTYPEYKIQVTEINGQALTDQTVSLKALQKVTVKGIVIAPDGNQATSFNGLVSSTVKDSKQTLKTLDNANTGEPFVYTDYLNTLYTGKDSVSNGAFSFTFTVPKDISYSNDVGKMNFYAYQSDGKNEAQGSYMNFRVGGTSENIEEDNEGPAISKMYLNDSTFVEGETVNPTPFFVAIVNDKSGINISGNGVGHDIILIIDNSPLLSYNLNDYYEILDRETGTGIIKFPIPELEDGTHSLEFKIWDICNNSTTKSLSFEVKAGLQPSLSHLTAGPNPARNSVRFHLYHNRPEAQLNISVAVYNLIGQLLWKHEESGASDLFSPYTLDWDLRQSNGLRLTPGIYLYRAIVSSKYSKEATAAKKLIVLAQ